MSDKHAVSVVVPTYLRSASLLRTLEALGRQHLKPLEVLVCYRESDLESGSCLRNLPEPISSLVRPIMVGPADNFAKSLNAGILSSVGEFVALTDDDAESPPDWIEGLVRWMDQPDVAGVGGRDIQPDDRPRSVEAGRVQWFGRTIGNHHVAVGEARDVDILKGVNCLFRGELIRELGVDPRLRGVGNVVHTELSFCLPIRRAGWRLIYDPAIEVVHHLEPRMDGDVNHRGDGFNAEGLRDLTHNEAMLVQEHLTPIGRLAHAVWATTVGTRFAPGLLQLARLVVGRPAGTATHWRRYLASQSGLHRGLLAVSRDKRTPLVGRPSQARESHP